MSRPATEPVVSSLTYILSTCLHRLLPEDQLLGEESCLVVSCRIDNIDTIALPYNTSVVIFGITIFINGLSSSSRTISRPRVTSQNKKSFKDGILFVRILVP